MKNQVLSIEQMQHLKELGVDTNKASMVWGGTKDWQELYTPRLFEFDVDADYIIEAFTLQDMLEVIRENSDDNRIDINITTGFFETWKIYVEIYHKHLKPNQVEIFEYQDLLPCVYDVFCWLAENNYIGGNNEERD